MLCYATGNSMEGVHMKLLQNKTKQKTNKQTHTQKKKKKKKKHAHKHCHDRFPSQWFDF